MRYTISLITLLLASSLISAPVVIKSKSGRLREVILEIDDNPYTAPELILGSSGVSVIIFPGIVQGCELSFKGYDYRKGMINKTTGGIFQEVVLRYDLSKVAKEKRRKLLNHRFSVSCSFEYQGRSKYVEFDTVFNDKKRYSFAWIRYKSDIKKDSMKLTDYQGFQFVRIKGDKISINDGSVEKAFETSKTSKNEMDRFQSVIIENGKVKLKE